MAMYIYLRNPICFMLACPVCTEVAKARDRVLSCFAAPKMILFGQSVHDLREAAANEGSWAARLTIHHPIISNRTSDVSAHAPFPVYHLEKTLRVPTHIYLALDGSFSISQKEKAGALRICHIHHQTLLMLNKLQTWSNHQTQHS